MREYWACLVEFPNYEVSTHGRIRNWKGRILRPNCSDPRGYLKYTLCVDGRLYYRLIHRLVAATFIDPNIKGFQIDHLDDDPSNNYVDNLEIVTPKVNTQRIWARGRRLPSRMKAVRIVETGEEFRNQTDCAHALNRSVSAVYQARVKGCRTAGYHIEEA